MAKKPIKVLFKKLCKDAVIPTKAHEGDACYDLTAVSCVYDRNLDAYVYGTGLAIETNVTTGMFIHPRSSVRKTDAFLTNAVGIVDSKEYRGEIMLTYKNRDSLKCAFSILLLPSWRFFPGIKECLQILRVFLVRSKKNTTTRFTNSRHSRSEIASDSFGSQKCLHCQLRL